MNRLSDSLLSPLTGGAASMLGPAAGPGPEAAGPPGASADPAGFAQILGRMQDVRAGTAAGLPHAAGANQLPMGGDAAGPGAWGVERQEIAAAFAMQWAALMGARAAPNALVAAGGAPMAGAGPGLIGDEPGEGVGDLASGLVSQDGSVAGSVPLGSIMVPWAGWTASDGDVSGAAGGEGGGEAGGEAFVPVEDGDASAVVGLSATLPPVVAWQLSPQLSVITAADGVAASDEALRAYAAGQGFDPVALQRMFGGDSASAMRGTLAGAVGSPGAVPAAAELAVPAAAGLAVAAPGVLGGGGANGVARGPAGALGAAAAGVAGPLGASGIPGATAAAASLAASAGAAAAWAAQADPNGRAGAPGTAAAPSSLAAALAVAAQAGEGSQGLGASAGAGQAAGLPGAAGGDPGLRQGMTSAWAALQARASGGLMAGPLGATALGADATAPLVAAEGALAGSGSGSMAGTNTAAAAASTTPVWAGTDAGTAGSRTEGARPVDAQPLDLRAHLDHDREVLARRVGEALAARVLAQVERGEWQIRLSVTPEQLGPIDIDLQVRGNRMEAQFQVANGQTQSLIQDGVGRLREAVGASGMDLASVWVSGGWNERNRGNPTPGQPDGPAPGSLIEGAGDEQAVEGVAAVDERRSTWTPRQGALDILI